MAKKQVLQAAPKAMSLEDMRAAVQAEDARIKADALAAKEAARKAVGRPKLSGERKQFTFHVLIDQMTDMRMLAARTNTPLSALLDEALAALFQAHS
jgi:phosphopantetheinyl transferase (holo-ACP synthase)